MKATNKDLERIIAHYGTLNQRLKAVEELNELSEVIAKDLTKEVPRERIIEEIADVVVMVDELQIIYNVQLEELNNMIDYKIERMLKKD